MKKTVVLRSPEQFKQLLSYLDDIPKDELHEVTIKPHKSNISVQQRSYYWVILSAIEKHTGTTKEELHLEYKKRWLVDIFSQSPDDHPGYGEMMESLREVYKRGMRGHARRFYDYVVKETSIMDALVPEMNEYIDNIIRIAAQELSFAIPAPEYK